MKIGFNDLPFQVSSSDGRNFVLLQQVVYVTLDGSKSYIMPMGATSDGASTPPEIWLNFPPFGSYWPAAFLHDCAYRGTLANMDGSPAMLPKAECDDLLLDAMTFLETHAFTRDAIYVGVALGGQSAFDSDRKSLPQVAPGATVATIQPPAPQTPNGGQPANGVEAGGG